MRHRSRDLEGLNHAALAYLLSQKEHLSFLGDGEGTLELPREERAPQVSLAFLCFSNKPQRSDLRIYVGELRCHKTHMMSKE